MGHPPLAAQIGVDVTTVSKWLSGDTSRLHQKNLEALRDFSDLNGVFIEQFSRGPVLWHANEPYETMLSTDRSTVAFPAVRLDRIPQVEVLGRTLQSPFGVVAGPATAHWDWCHHLLQSGLGFIETKTVVVSAREPREEPTLFCFVAETPLADQSLRSACFRIRTKDDDLCNGVGSNLGIPCPPPDVWIHQLQRLIGAAGTNQIVLPSVTGAPWLLNMEDAFADSLVDAAELVIAKGGSEFLVINASCPRYERYFR